MSPHDQKTETDIQTRYPKMLVLWGAQLMSVGALFFFLLFLGPDVTDKPSTLADSFLVAGLAALGTVLVVVSFAVKRKLLERSVDQQDIDLVQRAFIVAGAMCEVSALLGVIQRFLVNHQDYYLLFIVATVGLIFHFPRREHLTAASYKVSPGGSI